MSTAGPRIQLSHTRTEIALSACVSGLATGVLFIVVVLTLLMLISHGYPWTP